MNIEDLKKEVSLHFLYIDVKDENTNYKFYQDDLSHFEINFNSTSSRVLIHLRIKRNLKSLMIPITYLIEPSIAFYNDACNEKLIIPCNKFASLTNRGSYFEVTLSSTSDEIKKLNI